MPTWNSRGLRGSTLEDLLNRTNEKYAHNGLARSRRSRHRLLLLILIKKPDTSHLPILSRKVPWIILELYREFRCVSMQKNATPTPFRLPMFIRIRWLLWSSLKSRRE